MLHKYENHMDLEQIEAVATIEKAHLDSVDAISVESIGRKTFATGSHDRTIKIWDLKTLKCLQTSEADRYCAII
jgi:WD40 repeat protein